MLLLLGLRSALAYSPRVSPVVYDPIDEQVSLYSYFSTRYSTVEIGVFSYWLTNGEPFANATNVFYQNGPADLQLRDSRGLVQFANGVYSDVQKINFYGFGKHFYIDHSTAKGVISYRNARTYTGEFHFTDSVEQLREQALDLAYSWPNEDQLKIDPTNIERVKNDPKFSTKDCYFDFYYTMRYAEIPAKGHKYFPDIEYRMVTYRDLSNDKLQIVGVTGELVSDLCATRFHFEGHMQNTAFTLLQSYYFAIPMTLCCFLSLISTARLVYLSNSVVRIQRISFYSMLLQTIYDFAIGMIYIQVIRYVGPVYNHMCILSFVCFLQALLFDIYLMGKAFLANLQLQGRRFNPRVINRCIIAFYVIVFIYIFVQKYIPKWAIFIIIVLASSYWFIQSFHSFKYNPPGKPLPFDYIIIQSVVKFVPIIYFYGYQDNFVYYYVYLWYLIVASSWSGLQIFIILVQYCFGNRLCFGKTAYNYSDLAYKYDAQRLTERMIIDSPEFVHPQTHIDNYAAFVAGGGTQSLLEFVYLQGHDFIVPFCYSQGEIPSGQLHGSTGERENAEYLPLPTAECTEPSICMNPLHRHSLFYYEDRTHESIKSIFPPMERQVRDPSYCSCFYITKTATLSNFIICAICIDAVYLDHISNYGILKIYNTEQEDKYLRGLHKDQAQALFITPCGHCFHRECLQRWASENQQCPVDRQPIPSCGQAVWYE